MAPPLPRGGSAFGSPIPATGFTPRRGLCLGEDPADFERLRRNLHNDLQPPSPLEEKLAEHLAQVVWCWRRAGRMQEGFALRIAKDANLRTWNVIESKGERQESTMSSGIGIMKGCGTEEFRGRAGSGDGKQRGKKVLPMI